MHQDMAINHHVIMKPMYIETSFIFLTLYDIVIKSNITSHVNI